MAQRGYSSVGRAPPLHGGCQRFESAYLHNMLHTKYPFVVKMMEFELKMSKIQGKKSLWGIPWHSEAMKDVVTDDTLRGAGNKL